MQPFRRRLAEVARGAGIRRYRIITDERRWLRGGWVTFEVTGTARETRTFESLWQDMRDGIWGSI